MPNPYNNPGSCKYDGEIYLRGLNEAAAPFIGLVGISQGAWVAPLVAERESSVAFIFSVSGSLRPPLNQLAYEVTNEMCDGGAPAFAANLLAPVIAWRARRRQPIWWEKNGDFDPIDAWRSFQRPSLFVYGDGDQNVDVTASVARLRSTGLDASPLVDVRILNGIGHAMMNEQTGWLDEDYLSLIATWILNQAPVQD